MDPMNMDGIWELSEVLKTDKVDRGSVPATVSRIDQEGTIWVQIAGSSEETPINGMAIANVKPGDNVRIDIGNNAANLIGNSSSPAIGEREVLGITEPIKNAVSTAQAAASNALQIAQEVAEIAGDTNNHFWDDSYGAHVTDVEEDEWNAAVEDNFSDYDETTKPYRNILVGRLGILLRSCLNNLVSITRSAIAFFDGTGNNASNIIASFGANGAQIGKLNSTHMELDSDSLDLISVNGGEIATFGSSPRGIGISFLDGVAAILAQTNTYGTEDLLISSENGMRLMTGLENGSGSPAASQVHTIAGLDSDWESFANWQTVADGFATSNVNTLNAKFEANAYNAAGTAHPELRNVSIGMAIEADVDDADYPFNADASIGISASAQTNKSQIFMGADEISISANDNVYLVGYNKTVMLNDDGLNMATDIHPTDNPSNVIWAGAIGWRNSANSNWVSYLQPSQATNGTQTLSIGVRTLNGSTVQTHSIDLSIAKDGSRSVSLNRSAWLNALGLTTTNWAYLYGNSSSTDKYVRWRAVAGVVYIEWYYTTGAGISGSASFGTIPSGYRPSKHVSGACYGTGNNVLWWEVSTAGAIRIGTKGSSSSAAAYGTASYPLG